MKSRGDKSFVSKHIGEFNKVNYNTVHVKSMKWFYKIGLKNLPNFLRTFRVDFSGDEYFDMKLLSIEMDRLPMRDAFECLMSGSTYMKRMEGQMEMIHSNGEREIFNVDLGYCPVMFYDKKSRCGGSFILNGNEKLCRLLYSLKRNTPILQIKKRKSKDGLMKKQIFLKSQNGFVSTFNNFSVTKENVIVSLFYGFKVNVSMIFYCLQNTNDRDIFERISPEDISQLHILKKTLGNNHKKTRGENLKLIGEIVKRNQKEEFYEGEEREIAKRFLQKYLFPHIKGGERNKFQYLIYICKRLLRFVTGKEELSNLDSWRTQEVQTPATVFMESFRSILNQRLWRIKKNLKIMKEKKDKRKLSLDLKKAIKQSLKTTGDEIIRMLSTGEVPSYPLFQSVVSQRNGIFVMVEKTNFLRYQGIFRSIHRGRTFVDTKILDVRKFNNENWGFICPVNTPDGIQCGLLNHLSSSCEVTYKTEKISSIVDFLTSLPFFLSIFSYKMMKGFVYVMINNEIFGYVKENDIEKLRLALRRAKNKKIVHKNTEVFRSEKLVFEINTFDSRLVRPVKYFEFETTEMITPCEQMELNICLYEKNVEESKKEDYSHQEIRHSNFLSNVANLTPFSNFNQSPRNVYQCSMAKQTVGMPPYLNTRLNCENKTFSLDYVQRGMSLTKTEREEFENLNMGLNCVVAVLSYTAHDMEDAMIINKASYERGLFSAKIYENIRFDFSEDDRMISNADRTPEGNIIRPVRCWKESKIVDISGLPLVGSKITEGDIYLITYNLSNREFRYMKWKSIEPAFVQSVVFVADKIVNIKLRKIRNPTIGDKFSSRHGQKGILSFLWPEVDMPFTQEGIRPDVLINPHAFPSRMTIGMMVELLASKAAAVNWKNYNDATTFRYNEDNSFLKKFGKELVKRGYNYNGNEILYSGTKGTPLEADIFIGVCYYQRLRHMIKDKYQVRIKGIRSEKTYQPLKGRKRGGGIRFGEMERDGLLSYGASFLLKDRLLHCSDETFSILCRTCGNLFSSTEKGCRKCKEKGELKIVEIPFVLKYLINELAMMNIKLKIDT